MMQLAQMLRSDDMQDFLSALDELSKMPDDRAVGLLDQLALEPDIRLRCRAVDGMAKISPEKGEALALRFLNDTSSGVRLSAIHALFQMRSRAAVPPIAHLLATDPDDLVRNWAALALGRIGDASVIPILEIAAKKDMGTNHEGQPTRITANRSIQLIRSRLAGKEDPGRR